MSWTLAVEEQFYVVWPSVVKFAGKRAATALAVASMLVCPVLRYFAALEHGIDSAASYPAHLRIDTYHLIEAPSLRRIARLRRTAPAREGAAAA